MLLATSPLSSPTASVPGPVLPIEKTQKWTPWFWITSAGDVISREPKRARRSRQGKRRYIRRVSKKEQERLKVRRKWIYTKVKEGDEKFWEEIDKVTEATAEKERQLEEDCNRMLRHAEEGDRKYLEDMMLAKAQGDRGEIMQIIERAEYTDTIFKDDLEFLMAKLEENTRNTEEEWRWIKRQYQGRKRQVVKDVKRLWREAKEREKKTLEKVNPTS